jgi:archaellum component FlaC
VNLAIIGSLGVAFAAVATAVWTIYNGRRIAKLDVIGKKADEQSRLSDMQAQVLADMDRVYERMEGQVTRFEAENREIREAHAAEQREWAAERLRLKTTIQHLEVEVERLRSEVNALRRMRGGAA